MKTLQCEMLNDCPNQVTHIGNKGYIYCEHCAKCRRPFERTRPMKPWEVERIRAGQPIMYESLSQRAFLARYGGR